jgi:uncharacterized protein (TIGR03435 family)
MGLLSAQTPPVPSFEVASIKRTALNPNGFIAIMLPGLKGNRWTAQGVTLFMLIRSAYAPSFQLQGQIVGGPSWLQTDRFDVNAKAEGTPTLDQVRLMLQRLLAERFKLVVHRETRELPVLSLVLARSDGRLGRDMKPVDVDCNALQAAQKEAGTPPVPFKPGDPMPLCSLGMMMGGSMMRLESGGVTMAQLASMLSQAAGRPVTDRTGLTGNYAFSLEFAPEPGGGSPLGPLGPVPPELAATPPTGAGPASAASEVASIFVAVQEQLGLKLEPKRESTEVLAIDKAEAPTED